MGWGVWSILNIWAFIPPSSPLEILNMILSSLPPTCNVPCQMPRMSWAQSALTDNEARASILSMNLFMEIPWPIVLLTNDEVEAGRGGERAEIAVAGEQGNPAVDTGLGDQRIAESRLAALSEDLRAQLACLLPVAGLDLDERQL